jgi:hypothetical protein
MELPGVSVNSSEFDATMSKGVAINMTHTKRKKLSTT